MEAKVLTTNIRQRPFTLSGRSSYREYNKAPRVYVWPEGESIMEQLVNRKNRPIKLFRHLATEALKSKGVEGVKMRWSQYAGCTCPCSPGFILEDYNVTPETTLPFDVHVKIG